MTPSPQNPTRYSLESLRKQAKKLARDASANKPEALNRILSQLTNPPLPLSLRDAQFVIARENGYSGWQDLRTALLLQEGSSLEWAFDKARSAIHSNNTEQLTLLVQDHPSLLTYRSATGETLLSFATGSYGDSGDPNREQMFTRPSCAEYLLDAGAIAEPSIWEHAIESRARGVLQILSRRKLLPNNLHLLAALGDYESVQEVLSHTGSRDGNFVTDLTYAFLTACRFDHKAIAARLLDQCILGNAQKIVNRHEPRVPHNFATSRQ